MATQDSEHILPEWLYVPELENQIIYSENIEDFLCNNKILLSVLNNIDEGISILSPNLNILYLNEAMKRWYHYKTITNNDIKCYQIFHHAKYVCKNCPAKITLETKKANSKIVEYQGDNESDGKMLLHIAPILNNNGEIVLLLEYVRNISFWYSAESSIEDLRATLDLLEKQNKLLLTSLALKEQQYSSLKNTIENNIEQYVKPLLGYIKKNIVNKNDYLLIKSILDHSFDTFTVQQSSEFTSFTIREMQVAQLIKEGMTSKEIADELFVSKKAIDFYRSSIRKKLKIDKKTNLKVYLEMHLK